MAQSTTFDGQVAIVTGGAQGIGRAIVERLANSGAKVALWDRDFKLAEQVVAQIGTNAKSYSVDVGDAQSVNRAFESTLKDFNRVDILVNNAGIAGPTAKLWEYPLEELQKNNAGQSGGTFQLLSRRRSYDDQTELRPRGEYSFNRG